MPLSTRPPAAPIKSSFPGCSCSVNIIFLLFKTGNTITVSGLLNFLKLRKNTMPRRFAPRLFFTISQKVKIGGIHCTKFEPFLKAILTRKSELHPATICLGQRRRGDGLARAEEGMGRNPHGLLLRQYQNQEA